MFPTFYLDGVFIVLYRKIAGWTESQKYFIRRLSKLEYIFSASAPITERLHF